ncbi:blue copper protein-like [Quillaja saponaria]|uniref:Blue copper protein-like n=1 Tax=Quillaja saponaria TaxID=32244 RepID=A0AAD7LEK6_QUISA|nr:blue copper protein-like [Quillaja saponaria]KAJ7956719.1 blue copper protein-like [Quillaja saponaria]
MARKLNVFILVLVAVAGSIQSSSAQTRYVVGDALGWTIPQDSSTYTSWAANKNFNSGDTLVFNFTSGLHDVAQVTKAAFDSCSATNPISILTISPATITLNGTGEHYFICTFASHCSLGQKLSITVTSNPSSSPAPQPSTPSSPAPVPASTPPTTSPPTSSPPTSSPPTISPPTSSPPTSSPPTSSPPTTSPVPTPTLAPEPTTTPSPQISPSPAPATESTTYTVGDESGWTISPRGAAFYESWASGKTFSVGDVLVFNFANGAHNVAEVTKTNYNSCTTSSPISLKSSPPVRVTLTKAGEHFYLCAVPTHCSLGQKLAINVTGRSTATPPSATTTPSTPSPTSTVASPPPESSANTLGVAGLSVTLLSIAVAMFLY